jgi:hypothetical protein
VVDFTFTDDGGAPKLMMAQDAPQTTWSLKPFLEVPETVVIQPRSSETVNMRVAVPQNQGAGSYYSAIVYSSGAPDGGNVGLSASGVTLVFASIPGEVKEDLKLEKFGAYSRATTGKPAGYVFITADMPQAIAYTLKNDGNVAEDPAGSITITNMFGQETVINNINPNDSLALIGQSRTFVSCIKINSQQVDFNGNRQESTACAENPGLWPGWYTAKLELFYGQNGNATKDITSTAVFFYLPWWFLIALVIVLAVVAYFIWRFVRFIRARFFGVRYKAQAPRQRRRR